ncbi:MAG: hypothetical protein L6V79_06680 [Clostridium sp.]|nr:MAG: hypothetical protein L6V79_06680 [Clostridium sp.]
MAVFFKINSKTIKAPTELTCSTEVLDKSERTMDGTMVVDVIGRKRKVEVAWKYLSKEDMGLLTAETKKRLVRDDRLQRSRNGEVDIDDRSSAGLVLSATIRLGKKAR